MRQVIDITPAPAPSQTSATTIDTDRTISFRHETRALIAAVAINAIATVAAIGWLVWRIVHPVWDIEHVPAVFTGGNSPWLALPLSIAAIGATAGLLRSWQRLMDADAALVISAQGAAFRPYLFAERVRVPWSAISGSRFRSDQGLTMLALSVERAERFGLRRGFIERLQARARAAIGRGDEVSFVLLVSKATRVQVLATIEAYRARYGGTGQIRNNNRSPRA